MCPGCFFFALYFGIIYWSKRQVLIAPLHVLMMLYHLFYYYFLLPLSILFYYFFLHTPFHSPNFFFVACVVSSTALFVIVVLRVCWRSWLNLSCEQWRGHLCDGWHLFFLFFSPALVESFSIIQSLYILLFYFLFWATLIFRKQDSLYRG